MKLVIMGRKELPTSQGELSSTVLRYKSEHHNAELITDIWRSVFNFWVDSARTREMNIPTLLVPPLEVSMETVEQPILDIDGDFVPSIMVYIPPELKGKQGLILMGEMFPNLGTRTVKKNTSLQSSNDYAGWLNAEAVIEAPNVDTDEDQLRRHLESLERSGMSENQYIVL